MEIENFTVRVRAALGADDTQLPDEIISLPENRRAAEKYIATRIDYTTLDEDKRVDFVSAVVYKTALLLIPYYRMQIPKTDQLPGVKSERFEIDWKVLESELSIRMESVLADISPYSLEAGSIFTVTNL